MRPFYPFLFICLALFGSCDCGGSIKAGDLPDPITSEAAPSNAIVLGDQGSCATDYDCKAGNYCFQGLCAFACSEMISCRQGACDERGRCIKGQALHENGQTHDAVTTHRRMKRPPTILTSMAMDTA